MSWTQEYPPYTPWNIERQGVTLRRLEAGGTLRITEGGNIRILEYIVPPPIWSQQHTSFTPWTTE